MKEVHEEYGKSFFGKRYKLSWRAPHVLHAIRTAFNLNDRQYISYIDVGCAVGDLVACALAQGWDAYGIEGSKSALEFLECPAERVYIGDLRKSAHKFMLVKRFSVLSCFEVAEHLEVQYAEMFVKNLCTLSYNIIVSAAPPGQRGHHHYNCQPQEYWDEMFKDMGYNRCEMREEIFRASLEPWKSKDGIRAFYNNSMIYKRRA
jgi:hypothetical protein